MYKFSEFTEEIDFSEVGTKPWEPFDFSKSGTKVTPIIKHEEEEDVLLDLKAKLCRFDKDENQWKERGVGYIKLLKHKETKKFRLVMRQSGTLDVIVNHLVLPTISIQNILEEVFCARFASFEYAKLFKEMVIGGDPPESLKGKNLKRARKVLHR
ncbi:hypothetical protein MKW98_007483 [Papaver atlanticum]|uniref:RanBD1 domain-containing protein n=1 Tax=Papaver atlanticum TaxID=357466 RepID=A0AAD4SBV6_9MAGN|nr:hypothetical protein MKW98_007483 [Papaver atlanticum]